MRVRVDDLALRLVSVLLALSLWFAVAAEKSAEAPFQAPIEFRNVPEKLEIVGTLPPTIEVWLRGSPGMVQRITRGDVYAQVDLQGAAAGPRTVYLAAKDIRAPYAVTVAAIRPASFSFTLEPSVQRTLPVKTRLSGEPANGFRVTAVRSQPEQIVVSGPESRVTALDGIEVSPISVDQAQMTFAREVGLVLPDPWLRLVDSPRIRVTVRVEPVPKPAVPRGD